jgi:hypothetical protein
VTYSHKPGRLKYSKKEYIEMPPHQMEKQKQGKYKLTPLVSMAIAIINIAQLQARLIKILTQKAYLPQLL